MLVNPKDVWVILFLVLEKKKVVVKFTITEVFFFFRKTVVTSEIYDTTKTILQKLNTHVVFVSVAGNFPATFLFLVTDKARVEGGGR